MRISANALRICGAIFEAARPDEELTRLETRAAAPDFWKDQVEAQKILQRRRRLEQDRDLMVSLKKRSDDLAVLIEWAEAGEPVDAEFAQALETLDQEVQAGEVKKMLGGEHDRKNAIITIHPGAGGTESQDWAEMLLRMYMRWTERRGFKRELIDYLPGDEAGLKSATLLVTGEFAYGLLSAEAGVHRLVRISPFDQAARRHTSFASVHVYPELPEDVDVEIDENDLRIDTYRSSGAGGQHVNVTDSAVRLTHIPTGIVVSCQNERSQMQNKARAMQVLAAKIAERQREERRAEMDAISGPSTSASMCTQIRSYVLAPYQLVKDLRTDVETGNVTAVLDGDLDAFMEAYLQWRRRESSA